MSGDNLTTSPPVQETDFQHNVIDAAVLVLLSIAGADQKKNMKAASGEVPKAVSS